MPVACKKWFEACSMWKVIGNCAWKPPSSEVVAWPAIICSSFRKMCEVKVETPPCKWDFPRISKWDEHRNRLSQCRRLSQGDENSVVLKALLRIRIDFRRNSQNPWYSIVPTGWDDLVIGTVGALCVVLVPIPGAGRLLQEDFQGSLSPRVYPKVDTRPYSAAPYPNPRTPAKRSNGLPAGNLIERRAE